MDAFNGTHLPAHSPRLLAQLHDRILFIHYSRRPVQVCGVGTTTYLLPRLATRGRIGRGRDGGLSDLTGGGLERDSLSAIAGVVDLVVPAP